MSVCEDRSELEMAGGPELVSDEICPTGGTDPGSVASEGLDPVGVDGGSNPGGVSI